MLMFIKFCIFCVKDMFYNDIIIILLLFYLIRMN